MNYLPNESCYASMTYNRAGCSGLKFPAVSLGLWHNFGGVDTFNNSRAMVLCAFDLGITHIDLPADITDDTQSKVKRLNDLAKGRGQTLAQMALAWALRHKAMTSVLVGASEAQQIEDAVGTLNHLNFAKEELQKIEFILNE